MENQSLSYVRIIELNAKKITLNHEIKNLKPKAVRELRAMGYSFDKIVTMLSIGKINAIKYSKGK